MSRIQRRVRILGSSGALVLAVSCVPATTQITIIDSAFRDSYEFGGVIDPPGAIAWQDGAPVMLTTVALGRCLEDRSALKNEPLYATYPEGSFYRQAYDHLRAVSGASDVLEFHYVFKSGLRCHLLVAVDQAPFPHPLEMAVLDQDLKPAIFVYDDVSKQVGCYSAGSTLSVLESRVGLLPPQTTD